MIKIRIKNADHEIDVRFPINENELYAKLAEIHAIEEKDAPQSAFVTEVYWPEEFSMLKDRFANLDELNYLAKRMESFDYHEYDQFLIGITKLQNPTEKDLINLTFNLDHFTLCKDVSSYGKIGREYVMNTQGAVPANDEDDPKYAAIGKELIDKGLAQITGKGLLIYNPFDELTEVYDGQTFPEYYYENTLASAEVSYNGRTELLLLPGEELAIQKALARLGAPSDSDCEIKFCLNQGEDDAWEERIEGIIRSEGLYEANKMLRSLDTGDMDWGKLTAAVELTDVKSAANIAAVAEHLGEFAFIPDAKSESDVGHFLVDNVEEYEMNIEMEEYFDFSGFGEYYADEHDGQFVSGGFVYFDSDRTLDEFLEELESEDEGNDNMRRVYAYLLSQRGLDRDVVYTFAHRQMIYESAQYHNAVFVGFDREGVPRHANMRGTGSESTFKGNADSSIPEYSFHWTGRSKYLLLFEAPTDMLSFISMHKKNWQQHSYAAACSVSDRVLFQMLKDNPNISEVFLCMDSDEPGQTAAKRISDKLFTQGINAKIFVPEHKDWNEDLLALNQKESEVEEPCQVLQL